MESLYFLVPVALIFIAIAIKILWWAINNGQYDNLDTEAHRILFDDKKINTFKTTSATDTTTTAKTSAPEATLGQYASEQQKYE